MLLLCLFLLPMLHVGVLCCRGCTLCYGVVWRATPWGVFPGLQHMTAQPGLLPITMGPYMSQGHVTRGVKAENIIGGLVWALGRHCGKALGSYCLAGELPHILTVVQAGLGMTLPW